MDFFTSDHHFFHKNIVKFEDRGFDDVSLMNEYLVKIWNETVSHKDTVYHIGDLSFGNMQETVDLIGRLNGKIIVCKGNHDETRLLRRLLKEGVIEEYELVGKYLKRHGYIMLLTHFPMELGNRPQYFNIHGHIHAFESKYINQLNVGVDSQLFKDKVEFGQPISMDMILDKMDEVTPLIKQAKARQGVRL